MALRRHAQAETEGAKERARQADARAAEALAAKEAIEKERQEADRLRREAEGQAEVRGRDTLLLAREACGVVPGRKVVLVMGAWPGPGVCVQMGSM